MCSPGVDELSMMTYLSQFPNAKLKPGAPLRPRTNPSKVRAYGPGTAISHVSHSVSVCLCLSARSKHARSSADAEIARHVQGRSQAWAGGIQSHSMHKSDLTCWQGWETNPRPADLVSQAHCTAAPTAVAL